MTKDLKKDSNPNFNPKLRSLGSPRPHWVQLT